MKRARVLVMAAVLFAACPPAVPTTQPPVARPPAWRDGELSIYHVLRNDSVLFETRVLLQLDEELVDARPVPTAVVTTTVEPIQSPTFFYDSSTVVLRRDSLIPLRSFRNLETDLAIFDIQTTYEPGQAVIRRQTLDGTDDVTCQTAGWTLDQDMVRTAFRAVPPDPGTELRLTVVVPVELRARDAAVLILGTRLVVTPVDSIVCREYEYDTGTRKIRLWYEVGEPRRLVGLSDPVNGIVVKLVRYVPGRVDTAAVIPPR
ncbi:MAG: hypothetical protein R6X12_08295 [bacterium]